jgi:hypothetical protein
MILFSLKGKWSFHCCWAAGKYSMLPTFITCQTNKRDPFGLLFLSISFFPSTPQGFSGEAQFSMQRTNGAKLIISITIQL